MSAPEKRGTVVMVDVETCTAPNLPFEKACPTCGGELSEGFGLAFGGYGPYQFCEGCNWVTKHPEPVAPEPEGT